MTIQNRDFNWFQSTFVQTGKYCYGTILSENKIKDTGSIEIDNYIINVVTTNVASGELYEEYKDYSSVKRTAKFTDNQDGTWNVQLITYTVSVKPAKYEKSKAYPSNYVRPDNENKAQE